MKTIQTTRLAALAAGLLCLLAGKSYAIGHEYLIISNGYFHGRDSGAPFVPRGFSYQVFNPAVYATQDNNQISYDLGEIKAIRANSLRVEFVWGEVETAEGVYDWTRTDELVARAGELDLKLFVLIGYQYPPSWFAAQHPDRMGVHADPGTGVTGTSAVVNYSHPAARAAYADFVSAVCARYANSTAVAGWILGNEFAFYDLWEDPNAWPTHRYLGFDSAYSLPSFRAYLQGVYGTIAALNGVWGTGYASFNDVPMPAYPGQRANHAAIRQSGYHDVLQWRKREIGDFIAAGAAAARASDTNHLLTYSMVGAIFNGLDANNTCEDARVIVERCAAAGAPLDFWSINNYPWTLTGSEMRSVDFGIAKYRDALGLPVLITETGLSSTDSLFTETPARQAQALPGLMWESLMSGALGVHLFHWNDRDAFLAAGPPLDREAGFGVVQGNRVIKSPVYWNVMLAFLRMDDIQVDRLLAGSTDPRADVAVYWGQDADLGYNRMNQELGMTWAAFKRLGLQPRMITEAAFDAGSWTSAAAVYLPRAFQLEPARLDALETQVIATGIHVHAGGDLPGQFDAHHRANTNWVARMNSIFGLDVSAAVPGWDSGATNQGPWPADYQNVDVYIQTNVAPLVQSAQPTHVGTWKIWHGVSAVAGLTVATHTGQGGVQPPVPALHVRAHGAGQGKAAANTFALGDIINFYGDGNAPEHPWRVRRDFLEAIYRTQFGLVPVVQVSGVGAEYVAADYRWAANGSRLLSLLNMSASGVYVSVSAPTLLGGQQVEDLTRGALLASPSTGDVSVAVGPDELVLLYAYSNSINVAGSSLDNPEPAKVWIADGPMRVWPDDDRYPVLVRYDTGGQPMQLLADLIRAGPTNVRYGVSPTFLVQGSGVVTAGVPAQLFTLHDHDYVSSGEGGAYQLRAVLVETNGYTEKVGPGDVTSSFEGLARGTYVAPAPWAPASYGSGSQQYIVDGVGDVASDGTNGAFHVYQSHTTPGGYSGFYMTYTFTNTPVLPDDAGTVRFRCDVRETNGHPATLELQVRDTQNRLSTFSKPYAHQAQGFDRIEAGLDEFAGTADPHAISQLVVMVKMLATNKTYIAHIDNIHFGSGGTQPFAAETHVPVLLHWGLRPDDLPAGPRLESNTTYQVRLLWENLPSYLGAEIPTPLSRADRWPGPQDNQAEGYRVQLDLLDAQGAVVTSVWQETSEGSTTGVFALHTPALLTSDFYQVRGELVSRGSDHDRLDGFEDRALGNLNQSLALPWIGYSYAEQAAPTWLDEGIGTAHASEGVQSAFRVVWNPTNAGAWSGFGYIYSFPDSFDLFDPSARSNAWFSFDFREADGGHPCTLELQVKDKWGNFVQFTKSYSHPGPAGLDTIGATLDQFAINPAMDWQNVKELAINVRMEQKGVAYAGIFDDVQFLGTPAGGGGQVRGRFVGPHYTTRAAAGPRHYPFRGIAYSPYRDGQGPGWGAYPSTNEIRSDLLEVRELAPKIRTYSAVSNLYYIASMADQVGLDCHAGAWVAVNPTNHLQEPAANGVELTNLIHIGQAGLSHVKGLIVGNEVLYMERYENPHTTPERRGWILTNLIQKIQQVKAATGLPVATAEPYLIWTNAEYAALRDTVDYCIMHVHPYWNGVSVTGAAEFVAGIYYDTKRVFPGKSVIIGETGWPTEGHLFSRAVPGEANQMQYLREFREMADAHGIDYFWFEVFDEAWKFDGSVGPHWGIVNADRTWKQPFAELLAEESGFRGARAGAGASMTLDFDTYALNEYQVQFATNLFGGAWSNLAVVSGAAETNVTSLVLTNGPDAVRYLRMMPVR